jgi:hypothetical protein
MNTLFPASLALLVLGGAGCDSFTGSEAKAPAAEASSAPSAVPAAASSDEAVPTAEAPAPAPQVEAPKPTKLFALAEFKLPLSIELPEDATVEASKSKDNLGGVSIKKDRLRLRVMRADARLATTAAAKVSLQKKVMGAAQTFVREEPDLFVYTMKNGFLSFIVLTKVGGVMYACDGPDAEKEEELAPAIAACRTIKKAN